MYLYFLFLPVACSLCLRAEDWKPANVPFTAMVARWIFASSFVDRSCCVCPLLFDYERLHYKTLQYSGKCASGMVTTGHLQSASAWATCVDYVHTLYSGLQMNHTLHRAIACRNRRNKAHRTICTFHVFSSCLQISSHSYSNVRTTRKGVQNN